MTGASHQQVRARADACLPAFVRVVVDTRVATLQVLATIADGIGDAASVAQLQRYEGKTLKNFV